MGCFPAVMSRAVLCLRPDGPIDMHFTHQAPSRDGEMISMVVMIVVVMMVLATKVIMIMVVVVVVVVVVVMDDNNYLK